MEGLGKGRNSLDYTNWSVFISLQMAKQTKERILKAAKELFLSAGYTGTTVDAICERAELTKGSFYYFFKTKEDLGVAVLEAALQRSVQLLSDGSYTRVANPLEKSLSFLKHLEKCAPELWGSGCLLGSFSTELAETNPRMQKVVAGMFQAVSDDFAEKLRAVAAELPGKQAPSAGELADLLLGLLEGSIILAKAHREPARIPRAIRGFRQSLANQIGAAA
ncbi:TetR/AcrR family transcriptional regulator [soil metagenome]